MKKAFKSGFDLGIKLKELRAEKGFTQMKLSRLTGISNVQIARYEANIATPSDQNLKKISKALEIPFYQLYSNNPESHLDMVLNFDDFDQTIERVKALSADDILIIKQVMDSFIESRGMRELLAGSK